MLALTLAVVVERQHPAGQLSLSGLPAVAVAVVRQHSGQQSAEQQSSGQQSWTTVAALLPALPSTDRLRLAQPAAINMGRTTTAVHTILRLINSLPKRNTIAEPSV